MKLFTDEIQTAKLIALGFDKPSYATMFWRDNKEVTEINYILGELLSFLPKEIKVEKYDEPAYIQMLYDEEGVWEVGYTFYGNGMYIKRDIEFIDCIFQMCVKLKEEGVI
jgi:hypothetical protein